MSIPTCRSLPDLRRLGLVLTLLLGSVQAGTVPGLILPLQDVEVGTAVSGIVAEVLVREGDTVQLGQPLLRLNDEMEKLDVERSTRLLEKATFDHEAAQKLLAEKIGTREDALKKRIEYDLAVLQKQAAEVRLKQRTLTAPIQGIVVKRDKEPGETVLLQETVAQIVHIRQVQAQFYLEPSQINGLQADTEVSLTVPSLPAPNRVSGRVDFIDPRMDAESGLYRVKLRVDNADLRLKAGMRVEWQR